MFFNSLPFVAALLLFCLVYHLPGSKLKHWLLALAGIAFAWSFSAYDAAFIVAVFIVNQLIIVRGLQVSPRWHLAGIVFNAAVLFVWKYAFFTYSLFGAGQVREGGWRYLVAPVGISYYIFRAISYLVDIKNGLVKPERNWLRAAVYFFYFPIFIQGPVERARSFFPQLSSGLVFSWANVQWGMEYFLSGLFMKVAIADRLGIFVNDVFSNVEAYSSSAVALSILFYAIQLYADFGGYTRMAMGISACLGIQLSGNFNRPYFSHSITDFWRRWHISFSTWLNEYLFAPLSFSFRSMRQNGTLLAVVITFLVSGLWHGAGLTFLAWGLWHGLGLAFEIITRKRRKKLSDSLGKARWNILGGIGTFLFVLAGYILFRSQNLHQAGLVVSQIFRFADGKLISNDFDARFNFIAAILLGAAFLVVDYCNKNNRLQLRLEQGSFALRAAWCLMLLAGILFLGMYMAPSAFLYFQF